MTASKNSRDESLPKRSARPEGFEPPTFGLEVQRSVQLSYGRKYEIVRPLDFVSNHWLEVRRSIPLSYGRISSLSQDTSPFFRLGLRKLEVLVLDI